MSQISSVDQLRALYSQPKDRAVNKVMPVLDSFAATFIEHSHFLLLSTSDSQGFVDISPRGGVPGFVKIVDSQSLLIPDSAGNNRLDSLVNILARPQVGLMFMVKGIDEVIRLKGTASLHTDKALRQQCEEGGKRAKLVIKVQLESVFFHCAKAIMRGKLWADDYCVDRAILPSLAQITKAQQHLAGQAMTQSEMRVHYEHDLKKN